MKNLLKQLWSDEAGLVVSAELVFVTSILSIGMIVGISAARDGVTSELADIGDAVTEYNQGYSVSAIRGHGAAISGSAYNDNRDYCDATADDGGAGDEGCIARDNLQTYNEADATPVGSVTP